MLREEDLNQDLLAEYAFLDELDYPGWAWEFLRRNDEYRADYAHLQTLKRPEPFESEYESLSQKWHVRPFQSPDSKEAPEFFHERWQNISIDIVFPNPTKWAALEMEKRGPGINPLTWKRSVIAKDLRDSGYSLNKVAKELYPAYPSPSSSRRRPGLRSSEQPGHQISAKRPGGVDRSETGRTQH